MDKRLNSPAEAVAQIPDGAVVMIGGFGNSGVPFGLIDALIEHGAKNLTIISNNAGAGDFGLGRLLKEGQVAKFVCSYPRSKGSVWFEKAYAAGQIELEIVPQGTLAERIRAAGAGLGGFLTPTGYGTRLADGKTTRVIDGKGYVFEKPLSADFALVRGENGDRYGNLNYHGTARNFNPVMASAARHTIAEVRHLSETPLDPETVVSPGIFVKSIVEYGARP
ncbi:3-oxoacid CoA-transferase subunit A [Paracoccus albus]|uniref:3-oxoacid CoA-transferase subunit A n=1 Tax=Paracoccus albus TaxID=3017784 RepID=UPI0022F09FF0|nr:3-oxoacid CoA-transferase subunit A [Paracoccus albus]WBU59233.1 3-oxoacid CoA-transferase subunit A [Paracoccus albus]